MGEARASTLTFLTSLIRPNSWYGIKSGCWGTETCGLNTVPGTRDAAWFMGLAHCVAVAPPYLPVSDYGSWSIISGREDGTWGPESRFFPSFPSVRYCDVPE